MNLIGRELRGIRLIRVIGSGGMGTVYLGKLVKSRRGLPAGIEVAVKILHSHYMKNSDMVARFKREAGLGMILRHEGIVRIHHVGSERVGSEPLLFIVMEYLRGVTLRSVLDRSGSQSDDVLRKIGQQVAAALAEIHSRGIIHRDIKPENIFLEKNDVVKIGDFGLSQLSRRATESIHSGFSGSVAYAAPERFGPGRAESPSDLYSLGVVLYEMAVGSNPFLGHDLVSTISRHLDFVPQSPSDTGAVVADFTSHFIMALLAKDPRKRLGPPGRVTRILARGEESQWWKSVRPALRAALVSGRRAHFDLLRKTDFYGRKAESQALWNLLEGVRSGSGGQVALVRGEAGVGKTRLIDRLLERMDDAGIEGDTVVVPGLQSEMNIPYFSLIKAALSVLGIREKNRHEQRERLSAALTSLFGERSAAAAALTDLLVANLSEGAQAVLSPGEATHLFTDFFTLLSKKRLLVFVVEDVQGTGSLTRGVLMELARHIDNSRIMMILTVRTGESVGERGEQAERLGSFVAALGEQGAHMVDVERLDKESVRKILRDLGFPTTAYRGEVADRIFEVTEGNPYFVHEIARLLADEGALNKENPDWFHLLRFIPTAIQDVFYRRIFKLSPEERRFLDCASIFGLRFRVRDVLHALEMDLASEARVVSRLQNVLSLIRPTAGGMHRFDHVLIREMIYENLDEATRRSHHRRIGAWYDGQASERRLTGRELFAAAVHFSRGGDHMGVLRYFFNAYDYLLYKGSYRTALVLSREAASHLRALKDEGREFDSTYECRIYLRQARVAGHLGKRDMEYQALKGASIASDRNRVLRARVSLRLAQHSLAVSHFFSALNSVESALSQMEENGDRSGRSDALQTMAAILQNMDSEGEAEQKLAEALAIRRSLKDRVGEARILTDMATIRLEQGDRGGAEKIFEESLSVLQSVNDEEGIVSNLLGLGLLHLERGQPGRARSVLRRAARIAHRLGQSLLRGWVLAALAECFLEEKDHSRAARALAEARHMAEDMQDKKLLVRTLAALVRLRSDPEAGPSFTDDAAVLDDARAAVILAREAGLSVRDRIIALHALAVVFARTRKFSSALAITRKALELLPTSVRPTRIEKECRRLHQAATEGRRKIR